MNKKLINQIVIFLLKCLMGLGSVVSGVLLIGAHQADIKFLIFLAAIVSIYAGSYIIANANSSFKK